MCVYVFISVCACVCVYITVECGVCVCVYITGVCVFISLWCVCVCVCAENRIFNNNLHHYAICVHAMCVAGLLVMINCRNVKWVTRLQVIITSSKLIALAIIIIIGFVYLGQGKDTEDDALI